MMTLTSMAFDRADPLLILAAVVITGIACGSLAKKLRLPSMTGQLVGGLLIGRAGFDLFGAEALRALAPVTDFALGLIAVTVGAHLNWQRLRNAGQRLVWLFIAEATVTPVVILFTLWKVAGLRFEFAALLATIGIATAPATIVALVKETRSRGVYVKTLIAAVALNNLACIVWFEVTRALIAAHRTGTSVWRELDAPLQSLASAAVIGSVIALGMHVAATRTVGRERLTTAGVIALLLAVGLAHFIHTSALLTCLFLGVVQTNLTPQKAQLVDSVFTDFEPGILAVFFTLAGMEIVLNKIWLVASLALAYFVARIAAKLLAAWLAMKLARSTALIRRYLGPALIPQAGVAVGLVVLLQADRAFAAEASLIAATILTAVTANEVLGPLMTRWALLKSGDHGQDRSRLLDFLQEENIVTNLAAASKEEAIEKLVALLVRSHRLVHIDPSQLRESVLTRERDISTCIGGGLAIPHGELADCRKMYGVMGLSRAGLSFDTPDGEPVHCMVLLATPPEQRQRHLEVLAALAKTVGLDPDIKDRLFNARSPAHAHEILHAQDALSFNYYLDDGAERTSLAGQDHRRG
ncbi:MAG: PTS sugar transporter subunit IIA [Polyangiaceae bacterium]|nr:PTS sugar transporter subunit IIA [Polyangiaceae bacterium]